MLNGWSQIPRAHCYLLTAKWVEIISECFDFPQNLYQKYMIISKISNIVKAWSYKRDKTVLKVSEFQNDHLVSSFGPKYQQINLTISPLEFEKWSNHKIKALYNVFNTLNSPYNHI